MGGGLESRCVGRVYGADGARHGKTVALPCFVYEPHAMNIVKN